MLWENAGGQLCDDGWLEGFGVEGLIVDCDDGWLNDCNDDLLERPVCGEVIF